MSNIIRLNLENKALKEQLQASNNKVCRLEDEIKKQEDKDVFHCDFELPYLVTIPDKFKSRCGSFWLKMKFRPMKGDKIDTYICGIACKFIILSVKFTTCIKLKHASFKCDVAWVEECPFPRKKI